MVSHRRVVFAQLMADCADPVTECLLVCGPPPIATDWDALVRWRREVHRWLHDRHGWKVAWKRYAAACFLRQEIVTLVQQERTSDGFV